MPGVDGAPSIVRRLAEIERDLRRLLQAFRGSMIENVNTVTASGSTQTLPDVTTATMHDVTLTANCTLTFPTASKGKSFSLRLQQDATGSRTAIWPGAVKWQNGTAPILSTGAGKKDVLAFVCFDGTTWDGVLASADSR